jgi:hypothetical protein
MPRVRPLDPPAFLQRRAAFRPRWPRLDLDAPTGSMLSHPGLQVVLVRLLIRKDRHQTWTGLGWDEAKEPRSRHAIGETRTGHEARQDHAAGIDHQMPLAPCDFLAPISLARGRARKALTSLAHVPSSRHWAQSSYPGLLGSTSWGSMSHWPPLRLRENIVLRTSRMSTVRVCPPRGLDLGEGSAAPPWPSARP